ncbi:MAG: TPM domain-containing protein [Candidatus Saccharimonas sp.]
MKSIRALVVGLATAMLLMVGIVGTGSPQEAYAGDRCQPYAVDDDNIFGSQKDAVAAAAKSLETVGAEGRAVAVQSFGNAGTIDTYIDQMARNCPSWQMSGKLKQNFFAIAFSVKERKVAIYYGTQWKSKFDVLVPSIQSSVIAPRFKEGMYAQGVIAGFEAIKAGIKAPASAPNPSQTGAQGPSQTVPQQAPSAPFPWAVVFWILVSLIGIGLVVAAFIYWILPWVSRRRETKKLRDETIAIKQECESTHATVKAAIEDPELNMLFEDFSVAGDDTLSEAEDMRSKAQTFLAEAETEMEGAVKVGDPALDLSDSEYQDITSMYRSALDSLKNALSQTELLQTRHTDLIAQANEAAAQVSELDTLFNQANTTVLEMSQSGFDASALSSELDGLSDEAGPYHNLQDASAIALISELPKLTDRVNASVRAITDCSKKLASCKTELASLLSLHQAAVDKRLPAGAAFERMSTQYARSSWENIAGNGSKADKLLFRAKEMLDKVSQEPLTTPHQLDARVASLEEIGELIDTGDELLDAIIARESNIAEAQRTAADEISLAEADIDKAAKYLPTVKDDVDPKLTGALKKASEHLDNARSELAKQQPNYLVVVKQALLANGEADEVFAQAVHQHEYLESVRRQLETARSLFATSSDKSERYISNNSAEVDRDAFKLLSKARETFARVDKQSDIVEMLKVAKQALELANAAYDRASEDVAAAEAAREAVRAAKRAAEERAEREEREERERRDRKRREDEEERQRSYYRSSSSYSSSSSSSSSSFDSSSSSSFSGGGDFGGSSGSSGW